MRLDWLDDILAVAEAGSFAEAARKRCLTPSAFSRRIRAIEERVGIELFDRTRKPIQLHGFVHARRERIARISEQIRQLTAELRHGDRTIGDRLVISSQHALTTSLAPALLKEIGRGREDIHIRLRSANLAECFMQLLARQADIALVYRLPEDAHPIEDSFIESMTIGSDRLLPVIARDATGSLAGWRRDGEIPYIAYPSDVFLGQVMLRRILPRAGAAVDLRPTAETALTLASMEMATIGLAVAWVPASLARAHLESGRLVDLSADLPSCDLDVTAVRAITARSSWRRGTAWPPWQGRRIGPLRVDIAGRERRRHPGQGPVRPACGGTGRDGLGAIAAEARLVAAPFRVGRTRVRPPSMTRPAPALPSPSTDGASLPANDRHTAMMRRPAGSGGRLSRAGAGRWSAPHFTGQSGWG